MFRKSVSMIFLGCCCLIAVPAEAQFGFPHTSTHLDYVPHTTTHYDAVPHGDHYDVVPHTTTHYDAIPHTTTHFHSAAPHYRQSQRAPYGVGYDYYRPSISRSHTTPLHQSYRAQSRTHVDIVPHRGHYHVVPHNTSHSRHFR